MSARGRACIEVILDSSGGERLLAVVAHRPHVPVVETTTTVLVHARGSRGGVHHTIHTHHSLESEPPLVVTNTKVKGMNHGSAMVFRLGGGSSSIFAM